MTEAYITGFKTLAMIPITTISLIAISFIIYICIGLAVIGDTPASNKWYINLIQLLLWPIGYITYLITKG